jgi:hypothetical protein
MTKERKTTTPNPNDPNDTLIRGPIVQGKNSRGQDDWRGHYKEG